MKGFGAFFFRLNGCVESMNQELWRATMIKELQAIEKN